MKGRREEDVEGGEKAHCVVVEKKEEEKEKVGGKASSVYRGK